MLNTKQAVEILKYSGITDSEQVLLRWAREGKINGKIESRKGGYRFKEEDIKIFIEQFKEEDTPNLLDELNEIREENKNLKQIIESSPILLMKQNDALLREIKELKKELKEKTSG